MLFKNCYVLIFFIISISGIAQNRQPAFEMNSKLGRGINMGNCFEAPSENEWGNPWNPEYFKIMAELGFKHVRLPVRWEPATRSMSVAPYTIAASFLERIQTVVDTALKYDLRIIINMHHHDALFETPAAQKERFLSQWFQIADYFKDYPDELLFEVLNEPHGNISPSLWNEYFADALTEIRKTNPTRVVLLGVAEYGGLGGIGNLELPNDEYIILSPHYYNPFNFTHQGAEWVDGSDTWLGTEWNDTEADRETVMSEFSFAQQFSETNHIPIHVGEFGAYSTADMESRVRWTTFLARWFEENNMSWAWWEFSAGFGIYNPTTKEFVSPLVDALLHNAMPEPVPIIAIPVYTSDFSTTNGWSLSTQGEASGNLSVSSGMLNINITNGGTETWHVQLVKNNIAFEKDKLYRISFTGQAMASRSLTYYAGKASDPWNAYSSYNGTSVSTAETKYTATFTMTSPTDLAARLVFDLGTSPTNLSIANVKVEEIQFGTVTALANDLKNSHASVYPNPVRSLLRIDGAYQYNVAELYNLIGRKLDQIKLFENTEIDMQEIPRGFYLIRLSGNGQSEVIKVLKE
jgi:endoglucanase